MIEINRELKISLYEQIYESIKRDILSGRLCTGEKLMSKRRLSEQLGVSLITVENAYAQLIAEGYVRSAEKSGYFVQYNGEIIPLKVPPDLGATLVLRATLALGKRVMKKRKLPLRIRRSLPNAFRSRCGQDL